MGELRYLLSVVLTRIWEVVEPWISYPWGVVTSVATAFLVDPSVEEASVFAACVVGWCRIQLELQLVLHPPLLKHLIWHSFALHICLQLVPMHVRRHELWALQDCVQLRPLQIRLQAPELQFCRHVCPLHVKLHNFAELQLWEHVLLWHTLLHSSFWTQFWVQLFFFS